MSKNVKNKREITIYDLTTYQSWDLSKDGPNWSVMWKRQIRINKIIRLYGVPDGPFNMSGL